MKTKCLICNNAKNLKKFKWSNYQIYDCQHCRLHFCPDLIETEGNSSPVHNEGIKMMEDSFFKTEKIAFQYAKKRIVKYEKILVNNNVLMYEQFQFCRWTYKTN